MLLLLNIYIEMSCHFTPQRTILIVCTPKVCIRCFKLIFITKLLNPGACKAMESEFLNVTRKSIANVSITILKRLYYSLVSGV